MKTHRLHTAFWGQDFLIVIETYICHIRLDFMYPNGQIEKTKNDVAAVFSLN